MIHLALSILAFLFLVWVGCYVLIALGIAVAWVLLGVVHVVLLPVEIVSAFRKNRKRAIWEGKSLNAKG